MFIIFCIKTILMVYFEKIIVCMPGKFCWGQSLVVCFLTIFDKYLKYISRLHHYWRLRRILSNISCMFMQIKFNSRCCLVYSCKTRRFIRNIFCMGRRITFHSRRLAIFKRLSAFFEKILLFENQCNIRPISLQTHFFSILG